nr:4Fe-4S binding protein [Hespellia stercorisuis]
MFFVLECRSNGVELHTEFRKKGGYLTMAHVISDECVSCGACESECPVGAISQGADHYEIDADACVDCGACAAQCPTGAISAE